ncbi:MAG: 30S ribosomal protein S3 [Actinobacteria bacterium]|nr:30S ribosomal protein S3 [Actinomycetota bacterium]
MGQKVSPIGLRVGLIRDWESRWFATSHYKSNLIEDINIRRFLQSNLRDAAVSGIEIERAADKVKIDIFTARPGIVIGKKGNNINELRQELERMTGKQLQINIQEIKKPEINARLIAQSIAQQLESRVSYRKAMKKAVAAALRVGAKGIRVQCGGRLAGTEMARREWYREGRVPLHTLRANIDYGTCQAHTTFGCIGVKVWVYLGDVKASGEKENTKPPVETISDVESYEEIETEATLSSRKEEEIKDVITETS